MPSEQELENVAIVNIADLGQKLPVNTTPQKRYTVRTYGKSLDSLTSLSGEKGAGDDGGGNGGRLGSPISTGDGYSTHISTLPLRPGRDYRLDMSVLQNAEAVREVVGKRTLGKRALAGPTILWSTVWKVQIFNHHRDAQSPRTLDVFSIPEKQLNYGNKPTTLGSHLLHTSILSRDEAISIGNLVCDTMNRFPGDLNESRWDAQPGSNNVYAEDLRVFIEVPSVLRVNPQLDYTLLTPVYSDLFTPPDMVVNISRLGSIHVQVNSVPLVWCTNPYQNNARTALGTHELITAVERGARPDHLKVSLPPTTIRPRIRDTTRQSIDDADERADLLCIVRQDILGQAGTHEELKKVYVERAFLADQVLTRFEAHQSQSARRNTPKAQ